MAYIKDQHDFVSLEKEQFEMLRFSRSELLCAPCAAHIRLAQFHTSSTSDFPNKESWEELAATAKL